MKITLNLESDDMNSIPSSVTNWAITNWELGKLSLPLRFMFLFYNKKTTLQTILRTIIQNKMLCNWCYTDYLLYLLHTLITAYTEKRQFLKLPFFFTLKNETLLTFYLTTFIMRSVIDFLNLISIQ